VRLRPGRLLLPGSNHNEAIALLKVADPDAARLLETLLKMKTRFGYGHMPSSHEDLKKAIRAGDVLLNAARVL
jgi:hypothetical protein